VAGDYAAAGNPSLLQGELDRRLQAAQITDPLKRREDALRRDQARLTKSMERLLTGYQENLITLESSAAACRNCANSSGDRSGIAIVGDDGCRPNP